MFRTLRAKLVLSHLFLVILSVLLAGGSAGMLITRVQRQQSLLRTQTLAVALAQRIGQPMGMRMGAPDLLERLQREGERIQGRVMLLDRDGQVVYDSSASDGASYLGERVLVEQRAMPRMFMPPSVRRHTFADGHEYFVVLVELMAPSEARAARYLALALQVGEVDPPWRALLPRILLVGIVVIALALLLAMVVSNSITRPITEMTRAAEAMARGEYEHAIQAEGEDEVARLAQSFAHMSRQVSQAQRTQRDLLANVSHDLRTPLTSIQGFSQALLEGAVTDQDGYRRGAEVIHAEAERMGRLVQDLLDLARLESGQLDVEPQSLSIGTMLHTEVAHSEVRASEADVEIVEQVSQELPGITGDGHRLGQALANLLDNAIKYARKGTKVRVEAQHLGPHAPRPEPMPTSFGPAPTAGDWVCITIANEGEPIPEAELPRIFERFYRGDKSRAASSRSGRLVGRAEGSGLGLAIAREAILAHGGRIEVSSHAERGTRFRVWLPVGAGSRMSAA